MKRGVILATLLLIVITESVLCWNPAQASVEYCIMSHAKPVEVPYLDLTINQVRERNEQQNRVFTGAELDHADADYTEPGGDPEDYEEGTGEPLPELVESASGDETGLFTWMDEYGNTEVGLTYLGDWTTTAYCPCGICCGEYATGYTASGTLATANHTVACGSLPFGTHVMIDGIIYTVEDTGVEGEWIDIFFDSHDEALIYGMQTKEIYLVENSYE